VGRRDGEPSINVDSRGLDRKPPTPRRCGGGTQEEISCTKEARVRRYEVGRQLALQNEGAIAESGNHDPAPTNLTGSDPMRDQEAPEGISDPRSVCGLEGGLQGSRNNS